MKTTGRTDSRHEWLGAEAGRQAGRKGHDRPEKREGQQAGAPSVRRRMRSSSLGLHATLPATSMQAGPSCPLMEPSASPSTSTSASDRLGLGPAGCGTTPAPSESAVAVLAVVSL